MEQGLSDGIVLPSLHTITHQANLTPPVSLAAGGTITLPTLSAQNLTALTTPTFAEAPLMTVGDSAAPRLHDEIGVNTVSRAPAALSSPGKISQGYSQIAGHMTIDVVAAPGASFSNAASAALQYAAIYLGNLITDPIAVTIQANLSNLSGTPSLAGALAYGSPEVYYQNFATVRSEMIQHDPGLATLLPTSLPASVNSRLVVSKAEMQAWGLGYTASYNIGGSIVINTAYASNFNYSTSITPGNAKYKYTDFVGLAEHELSHALGRVCFNNQTASANPGQYLFGPMDFFRFLSPGTLQIDGVSSSSNLQTPYFSLNDGTTSIIGFASVSRSDWGNPPPGVRYSADAFNGYAPTSGYARMYKFDRSFLNAIGFDVNCFAANTRILTKRGEIAVENLTTDDHVVLQEGGTAPIIWIGQRQVDLTNHPNPASVQPVLICADALADCVPARDLLVSPDHALLLDGHLIPAKALLNGHSIRQQALKRMTYYHIELPEHAVLYAEGVAAESYLDTGNRDAFANAGIAVSLHPDFAPLDADADALRAQKSCAPLVEFGPVVERIRADILARAAIITSPDPEITIITQPDGATHIQSRSTIPGFLGNDPRDRRRLGVKIVRLHIDGQPVPLDHPALTEGWHNPEPDGRWTHGAAIIPAHLAQGKNITVEIAATLAYPVSSVVIAASAPPCDSESRQRA